MLITIIHFGSLKNYIQVNCNITSFPSSLWLYPIYLWDFVRWFIMITNSHAMTVELFHNLEFAIGQHYPKILKHQNPNPKGQFTSLAEITGE